MAFFEIRYFASLKGIVVTFEQKVKQQRMWGTKLSAGFFFKTNLHELISPYLA
jgi:hypothetical protein